MNFRTYSILLIAGTRPNFIKVAPLMRALRKQEGIRPYLLHSGQHYDAELSDVFFRELQIPQPDFLVSVKGDSPQQRFGSMLIEIEKVIQKLCPTLVIVVGDVDTTLAASLAAKKLKCSLAHVEAGLRSFDRSMPEELNRLMTDGITDYLLTTGETADHNLQNEGFPAERIFRVGNIMIDTLHLMQAAINKSEVLKDLNLEPHEYALVTIHRPSNVDTRAALERVLDILEHLSQRIRIVWPVHPRTEKNLKQFGLWEKLSSFTAVNTTASKGYVDFSSLLKHARMVITDSGGVQEETTAYGCPCITLRTTTERPETLTEGTSILAGESVEKALSLAEQALAGKWKQGGIPDLWDGHTAERIADVVKRIGAKA